MCMDEVEGVRQQLKRSLGQDLPDPIWRSQYIQGTASEYLEALTEEERIDIWEALEEGARERLGYWSGGREEGLRGVQDGTRGGSREMHEAEERDMSGHANGLDGRELVGDRTRAMTGAMSALFALLGDQIPEVKEFRERVLPGRFLTPDEAHALMHPTPPVPFPAVGSRSGTYRSSATTRRSSTQAREGNTTIP